MKLICFGIISELYLTVKVDEESFLIFSKPMTTVSRARN